MDWRCRGGAEPGRHPRAFAEVTPGSSPQEGAELIRGPHGAWHPLPAWTQALL